jgi:hypothetical protein
MIQVEFTTGTLFGLLYMRAKFINVTAFIDWDTARRCIEHKNSRLLTSLRKEGTLRKVIESLTENIATALYSQRPDDSHSVTLRVYHGWYRGETKTDDRRALEKIAAEPGVSSRTIRKTIFREITFCDYLLSDHDSQHMLYDTLRRRKDGKDEQKMIDTVLTCDVLEFVRSTEDRRLALIVGNDDDLIPALLTAHTWGRNALLLRITRDRDNQHINTKNLIIRPQRNS